MTSPTAPASEMTKREEFVKAAMQGLAAINGFGDIQYVANWAVKLADAQIAALNEGEK